MRPLEGVVVSTGAEMLIRLKSGATVCIPQRRDLLLGDTCFILFDYTRLEVRDVWSEGEYYTLEESAGPELNEELPPDWELPHIWAILSEPGPDVSL